jgi:hypothetical protein
MYRTSSKPQALSHAEQRNVIRNRVLNGTIRWHTARAKLSTFYWLYDTYSRVILAFTRYGRSAELRILMNGVWVVHPVQGLDEDIALIERSYGLNAKELKRNYMNLGTRWLKPSDVASQWTEAPDYSDPNFDYRTFFKKMREEAPPYILSGLFKRIKASRYAAFLNRNAYRWEDVYSAHAAELWEWFREQENDCKDNFRVARVGDRQRYHHYMKQKRRGCCGSVDTTTTLWGTQYHVGYNYGH